MIALPKVVLKLGPPIEAAPAPLERDYLSFSAIRTYQNCPLRYYFRYIAGVPEKTVSASLVFGAGIHRAIRRHFQEQLAGNEAPLLDELMESYEQEWSERGDDVQFIEVKERVELTDTAARILAEFQVHAMAFVGRPDIRRRRNAPRPSHPRLAGSSGPRGPDR